MKCIKNDIIILSKEDKNGKRKREKARRNYKNY